MLLAKNDLEEEIARTLSNPCLNWTRAIERYKIMYGRSDLDNFAGLLAEIDLRLKLEDLCCEYKGRLVLDPINCDVETANFSFSRINGRLVVGDKAHGRTHSEIDELITINGLPVIFEVKTGLYKDGSKAEEKNNHRKIQYVLRLTSVEYLIKPLEEYFGSKCGYVVLIPADFVWPHSYLQRELKANNGIVTSFGFKRDEFRHVIIPKLKKEFEVK